MNNTLDKLQQLALNRLATRLKHLRGKHDQLDHAWNRGMGRGGGGADLAPNQMGPLPTADFYRKRRIELMDQQRQGQITNVEMRREMRQLRGITVDALETNQESENITLANANFNYDSLLDKYDDKFSSEEKKYIAKINGYITDYMMRHGIKNPSHMSSTEWALIMLDANIPTDSFAWQYYSQQKIEAEKRDNMPMLSPQQFQDSIFADSNDPDKSINVAINKDNYDLAQVAFAVAKVIMGKNNTGIQGGYTPIYFNSNDWKKLLDALELYRSNKKENYGQDVIDYYQKKYEEILASEDKIEKPEGSLILQKEDLNNVTDRVYAGFAQIKIESIAKTLAKNPEEFPSSYWLAVLDDFKRDGTFRYAPSVYVYYENIYNEALKKEIAKNYPDVNLSKNNFSDESLDSTQFLNENEILGTNLQYSLDGNIPRPLVSMKWTKNQLAEYFNDLIGMRDTRRYTLSDWKDKLQKIARWAQINNISPKNAKEIAKIIEDNEGKFLQFSNDPNGYETAYKVVQLQELHHKRGIAISKMSDEEQNATYDKLVDTINSATRDRTYSIENEKLANNCETVMALALYGNPNLRLRIMQDIENKKMPNMTYIEREARYSDRQYSNPVGEVPGISRIVDIAQYYSLEYRLLKAMNNETSMPPAIFGAVTNTYGTNPRDIFIQNFSYTHTGQTTTNILGAAIQTALSQIGPNASASAPPSMYPPGVIPPKVHPQILQYLQEQYDETQEEYAKQGVTEVELYRGTRNSPVRGIPMSPWSTSRSAASGFTQGMQPSYINNGKIPVKYIFMNYMQNNFVTRYSDEYEYLILETAAVENGYGTEMAQGSRVSGNTIGIGIPAEYVWTFKQLRNRINVFAESNGIVDHSLVSVYEPQYDIFYNFKMPMKKKSLLDRVNALRSK